VLSDVLHDADDGEPMPGGIARQAEALAEWVVAAPQSRRHALVDDGYCGAVLTFAPGEPAARNDRRADGTEKV
jgi:hypothetical protein